MAVNECDQRLFELIAPPGPGSGLEFLLGATSIADLSARVEYMNALTETGMAQLASLEERAG